MDTQDNPPKLEGAAPPQFHEWSRKLYEYMQSHRIVDGIGFKLVSADGGGLQPIIESSQNLPLFAVDIVAVGVDREGVLIPMLIPPLEEP